MGILRLSSLTLLLAACASAGTNYDPARAAQLLPGSSTTAEARALLGKPNSESFAADSSIILLWMHSTGNFDGSGTSRYLSILFDRDGRMVRVLSRGSTDVH